MKLLTITLAWVLALGISTISFADASEKVKATSEQVSGSVESSAGELVGNEKMKSEGKAKKLKGDLRSTKEDVKDSL